MTEQWTLGLIGCGNMGSALIRGAVKSGLLDGRRVVPHDVENEKARHLAAEIGARHADTIGDLMDRADTIVLATKPQGMEAVLGEIAPRATAGHLFISIAAGIPLSMMEKRLGDGARVIRVMPNTPALLGCGAAGLARGNHARNADMDRAMDIFQSVGVAVEVPESRMDAVTGLSGSGPAYVFRLAEALARAGEKAGLPAEAALLLTKQTILGAARMMMETSDPPAELRRKVTSPGGTTEAGLRVMEDSGFEEIMERVVLRATERGAELGRAQKK
jgi:pyrroline-5-carboxylate reductase